MLLFYFEVERIGSPGIAVIVTPAVALLPELAVHHGNSLRAKGLIEKRMENL